MKQLTALVIDEQASDRKELSELFRSIGVEVTGSVTFGRFAAELAKSAKPDFASVGLRRNASAGLDTISALKRAAPQLPFFVLAKEGDAEVGVQALYNGALDVISKAPGSEFDSQVRRLVQTIATQRSLARLNGRSSAQVPKTRPAAVAPAAATPATPTSPRMQRHFDVVVIGVSTGGPESLKSVIPKLTSSFRVPVLMVQHMPANFTKVLAERLDALSSIHVHEALEGEVLKPGNVYVAPGGRHMQVSKHRDDRIIRLTDGPAVNKCRPAVDVLLDSVAKSYNPPRVLSLIMTGMGSDGLNGCRALKRAGGYVMSQSRESCVVWGMPKAVEEAGVADEITPLADLGRQLNQLVSGR